LSLNQTPKADTYDAIVLAVSHDQFKKLGAENIRKLGKKNHVLYDLKYLLPKDSVDMRL
jgi:UDP-N-acetyl-D-galactosamine dehydrogenase